MARSLAHAALSACALALTIAPAATSRALGAAPIFSAPQDMPSTYPITLVRAAQLRPSDGIRVLTLHPAEQRAGVLELDVGGDFIAQSSLWSTGPSPKGMVVCDVDADQLVDLLIANTSTGRLAILKQTAAGGFSLSVSAPVATGPIDVAAADIDGDGHPDAALADYSANRIVILRNNGSGVFTVLQSISVPQGPTALEFADVTGDGRPDLAVACQLADRAAILVNSGTGTFSLAASIPTGARPRSVCAADFDVDGLIDLVFANSNSGNLTVIRSTPGPSFAVVATLACGVQPGSLVARDVTLDGRSDILAANLGENAIAAFEAGPDFAFTRTIIPITFHPTTLAVADITNDSKPDLIVGRSDPPQLVVLTNAATTVVSVCPGDLNGDLYVNAADFTILAASFGQKLGAPLPGDVNRDGRVDVLDFVILASHFKDVCGDS